MSAPLLVIDIGNTSTTTAMVDAKGVHHLRRFARVDGVSANLPRAMEIYGPLSPRAIAIGSVVPEITPAWRDELAARLQVEAWELVPGMPLSIPVTYPKPESIGADRLANAVAAAHGVGAPVVVADFGTALTFDIVLKKEGYVGGVIAPGIEMMYSYFGEKTALLPKLRPQPADKVIGKSTAEAMHAGAHYGYRGMVREIFHEIRKTVGHPGMRLVATGGFAKQVLHDFDESVMILPTLTLEGLALARVQALNESL